MMMNAKWMVKSLIIVPVSKNFIFSSPDYRQPVLNVMSAQLSGHPKAIPNVSYPSDHQNM